MEHDVAPELTADQESIADRVTVARALGQHPTLADTLEACDIAPSRWHSFAVAFASLQQSEVVRER